MSASTSWHIGPVGGKSDWNILWLVPGTGSAQNYGSKGTKTMDNMCASKVW